MGEASLATSASHARKRLPRRRISRVHVEGCDGRMWVDLLARPDLARLGTLTLVKPTPVEAQVFLGVSTLEHASGTMARAAGLAWRIGPVRSFAR